MKPAYFSKTPIPVKKEKGKDQSGKTGGKANKK